MAQLQTTAVTGSLTVTGNITAQSLVVQTITSSISYITGSTIFGSSLSNTHQITGSFSQTGSLAYFAGNVGIGTTAPSYLLDIASSTGGSFATVRVNNGYTGASDGSQILLGNSANFTNAYFRLNGGGNSSQAGVGSLNIGVTQAVDMAFYTSNTERIRVLSGGNVGIGTTSPNYKLKVEGDVGVTSTGRFSGVLFSDSRLMVGTNYGDQTYANIFVGGALTSGASQYALLLDPQLSGTTNYGILANARIKASTAVTTAYGIYVINNELLSGASIVNNYGIYIANQTNGSSVNYALFSAGGLNYFGGNVGIGTTSPAAKLDIAGAASGLALSFGSTVPNNPLFLNTYGGWSGIGMDSATAGLRLAGDYSSGTVVLVDIGYYTSATVSHANWVSRLKVINNGNVGIGSTSPAYKLDINGVTRFQDIVRFKTESWNLSDDNISRLYFGANDRTYFGSGNGYEWRNNADGTLMVLLNGGNLGIGTTSPSYKLHTVGTAYISNTLIVDGGGNTLTLRKGSGNAALAFAGTSDQASFLMEGVAGGGMQFYTSAGGTLSSPGWTSRMYVSSSGNIGIGTTAPTSILQLGAGSYTATNTSYNSLHAGGFGVLFRDAYDAYLAFNTIYTAGGWVNKYSTYKSGVIHMNDGALSIETGTGTTAGGGSNLSTRLVMTNDGCVGIGTTSPIARLDLGSGYGANGEKFFIYNDNSSGALAGTKVGFYMDRFSLSNNISFVFPTIAAYPGSYIIASKDTSSTTLVARMTVLGESGNVGIGTTSPTVKLEVIGNIYANDASSTAISVYNAGSIRGKMSMTGNEGDLTLYRSSATATVYLSSYYDSYFNGGNLGIGTTAPIQKLDVRGNIHAEGANNHLTLKASSGDYSYLELWDGTSYGYLIKNITSGTANGALAGALYTYTDNNKAFQHIHAGSALFTILSGGSVGIGTTAPTSILHVRGSDQFIRVSNTNVGNAGIKISYLNEESHGLHLMYNPNSALSYIDNTYQASSGQVYGDIYFRQNVGGTMTSRMMIKADGGYIGIGTTAPKTILDVYNNTDIWHFMVGGGTSKLLVAAQSPSGIILQGGAANTANNTFVTSPYNIILQRDGGNVGIGTTSPAAKLQITGSSNVVNIRGSGSLATSSLFSVDGAYGRLFEVTDDLSNSLFSVNTIAGLPVIEAFADYSVNLGTYSAASGSTMRITGSSVGIGTTTPAYALDVRSNSASEPYVQARFLNTNLSNQFGGILVNGINQSHIRFLTGTSTWGGAGAKQWQIRTGAAANVDALSIYSWTLGSDALYINSNGNIGIGTTAPGGKLDLSFTSAEGATSLILRTNNSTAANGTIRWRDNANNNEAAIGSNFNVSDPGALEFINGSTTNMVVRSTGDVGIGTSSPDNQLHVHKASAGSVSANGNSPLVVENSTNTYINILAPDANESGIIFGRPTSNVDGGIIYNSALARGLEFRTAGNAYRMGITADGNLGIGTTAPVEKLQVAGNIRLGVGGANDKLEIMHGAGDNDYAAVRFYQAGTNNQTIHAFSANWQSGTIYNASAGAININGLNGVTFGAWNSIDVAFATGGTNYFKGNVGIGTTSPGYKLDVVGSGRFNTTAQPILLLNSSNASGGYLGLQKSSTDILYIGPSSVISGIGTNVDIWSTSGNGLSLYTNGATTSVLHVSTAGDVGIGTTNPSGQLSGTKGLSIVNATNAALGLSNGTNHWLNYLSSTTYRIWNNSVSEVVTILLNGNVGIGTTVPSTKLHVEGTITVTNGGINIPADYPIRKAGDNSIISYSSTLPGINIGSGAVTDMVAINAGGTEKVRINTSGSVGIGTTSPTRTLDVRGSANIQSSGSILLLVTGSQGELLKVQDSGSSLGTLAVISSATTNVATFTTSSVIISGSLLVSGSTHGIAEHMILAISDETTNITTGTAKVTFRAPFAMTLTQIPRASLSTASTSGLVTVDINEAGTSILGANKLSIDANELTSTTAATPTTLADTSIADDAQITIDIDGAGTGAKGLKVTLYYVKV